MVSCVVGGIVVVVVGSDMAEDEAGAVFSEDGADEDVMAPLDGAMAPELAGALVEASEPASAADMAPSVEAAGAVSWAGFWQAAIDRAAAPAARISRVFMAFSGRNRLGRGWPAVIGACDRLAG
jgi:hypothetical protein